MTIKELAVELKSEFEDFSEGYGSDYPQEDVADEFAMDYFGSTKGAISFLNGLSVYEFMQVESGMIKYYDDPTAVLSWMDDPQEMANEIIGFVVRNYVIKED